jgi:hypothetical protein
MLHACVQRFDLRKLFFFWLCQLNRPLVLVSDPNMSRTRKSARRSSGRLRCRDGDSRMHDRARRGVRRCGTRHLPGRTGSGSNTPPFSSPALTAALRPWSKRSKRHGPLSSGSQTGDREFSMVPRVSGEWATPRIARLGAGDQA